MDRDVLQAFSTLGDIGFVAPPLGAALVMLAARREYAVAARFGGAFLLATAVTGLLKNLLRGDVDLPYFPSGHVAVAASFYGGLLALFLSGRTSAAFNAAAAALVAGAVGWSRVLLTEHTWVDVAGGLAVGFGSLLLCGCLNLSRPLPRMTQAWAATALIMAAPAGLSAQAWLGHTLRTMVE